MVGLKRLGWGLIALWAFIGNEAPASNYVDAVGTVTIDKTCGKTALDELKVLVIEETPMGYSRSMLVHVDENGVFSVSVSKSYKYTFQVKLKTEVNLHLEGKVSFDPSYAENKPDLVANCREIESKKA